jgi:hypothetical protein
MTLLTAGPSEETAKGVPEQVVAKCPRNPRFLSAEEVECLEERQESVHECLKSGHQEGSETYDALAK